jgi:hypothetical protein
MGSMGETDMVWDVLGATLGHATDMFYRRGYLVRS